MLKTTDGTQKTHTASTMSLTGLWSQCYKVGVLKPDKLGVQLSEKPRTLRAQSHFTAKRTL